MKAIKRELDAITKSLKALTKRAESISEKLNKMAAAPATKTKEKAPVKTARKPAAETGKSAAGKAKKKAPAKAKSATASDTVLAVIKRNKKGIDTARLKAKTGFNDTKVRNVIFRLKKQGKIKAEKKGIYVTV